MRQAIERANYIRQKWGGDLDRISDELGLLVLEERLSGRLREVYFGDAIVVRSDLPLAEKRELMAHGIGHHLLHAGNHFAMQKRVYSFGNYHEVQANAFAAWLLVPEDALEAKLRLTDSVAELADEFTVTEELMILRLRIRQALEQLKLMNAPQKPAVRPVRGEAI